MSISGISSSSSTLQELLASWGSDQASQITQNATSALAGLFGGSDGSEGSTQASGLFSNRDKLIAMLNEGGGKGSAFAQTASLLGQLDKDISGGLSLDALSDKDREDIRLAAELGVDFLAVSFCRSGADIEEARRLAREAGSDAHLVAKIERAEAIEALGEIIDASDVVMVARGDLGVEIGDAELPGLQKKIIRESLERGRVVITATQMLQSMVESPIPTRAEVLDVANAVIDGTDTVMLSAETAAGSYPVKAVEAMVRICLGAERQFVHDTDFEDAPRNLEHSDQAIALATMFLTEHISVRAILALTESGGTARHLSRFRSNAPIYGLSRHAPARRRMAMMRGVYPIDFDSRGEPPRKAARHAIADLFAQHLLDEGDRVLITSGDHMEHLGTTNTLRLLKVGTAGAAEGLGDF